MKRSTVQQLLTHIDAPKSAVSAALMIASDGTEVIRVFYDPGRISHFSVPKEFHGYKVEMIARIATVGYGQLACH